MSKPATSNRAILLAVTTALATTTLAGCTTHAAPRADLSANKAQVALAKGEARDAVAYAEDAVKADPRNAAYRTVLGATYMEAGRFQSAATSFKDAMDLGDNSARTALSYALAEIATGNSRNALVVLNDWRDAIDPADLGLALSLAGDPDRGVHVLGNALRNGQNTAKVRQNLAYSYALKGDWRSARLMAAEDVPADQVSERIAQWAQTAHPDAYQQRVAALLGAPVVADSGQPAMLALSNNPGMDQMVAEAAAAAAPGVIEADPAPARVAAATSYELPPLGGELAPVAPQAAPVAYTASVAPVASPAAQPETFATAFAMPAPGGASMAEVAQSTLDFVSNPVVQATPAGARPARVRPARAVAEPAEPTATATAATPVRTAAAAGHLVQLGSFSSEASARRAWGIYQNQYPQLDRFEMVITKAVVRGKTYYRVSAGGLQRAEANSVCSTVKARGQGCIAWAAGRPLPGAVDNGVRMAAR